MLKKEKKRVFLFDIIRVGSANKVMSVLDYKIFPNWFYVAELGIKNFQTNNWFGPKCLGNIYLYLE